MRERDEHDDDAPVGRVLTRREVVRLLAMSGAAVVVGCERGAGSGTVDTAAAAGAGGATPVANGTVTSSAALPGCVVRPELTVGPYFVDKQLERIDIRSDPATGKISTGKQLVVTFNV